MMDPEDLRVKDLQQLAWGLQSLTNKPGGRLPDKYKSECYKLASRAVSLCSDVSYTEESDFVERSKVFTKLLEEKKLELAEVEESEKAKLTGKCFRSTSGGYYKVGDVTDSAARSAASADTSHLGQSLSSTAGGVRALTASEVASKCAEDPEVLHLCHLGLGDSDMEPLCQGLKQAGSALTSLDVSHNLFADVGIQRLVSALAAGTCPQLKELHVGSNSFSDLGTSMLKGGLATLRRNLVVHLVDEAAAVISAADLDHPSAPAKVAQELASPLPTSAQPCVDVPLPTSSTSIAPPAAAAASAAVIAECPAASETGTADPPLAPSCIPPDAALDGEGMRVELVEASNGDGLEFRAVLSLPEDVSAASDLDVDVSALRIVVRKVSGFVVADVALPCAVIADAAQAKFSRKRRTMTFTLQPVDPAAAAAVHGA